MFPFAMEAPMSTRMLIVLAAAGMLLQTGVGRADAIDGDWCSTDGLRMSIHAEKITTPGGKQIDGICACFRLCRPGRRKRFGRSGEHHPAQRVSRAVAPGVGRCAHAGMASLQGNHQPGAFRESHARAGSIASVRECRQ
jgi:hypothetical protein